jgi:hypothetical protein
MLRSFMSVLETLADLTFLSFLSSLTALIGCLRSIAAALSISRKSGAMAAKTTEFCHSIAAKIAAGTFHFFIMSPLPFIIVFGYLLSGVAEKTSGPDSTSPGKGGNHFLDCS